MIRQCARVARVGRFCVEKIIRAGVRTYKGNAETGRTLATLANRADFDRWRACSLARAGSARVKI